MAIASYNDVTDREAKLKIAELEAQGLIEQYEKKLSELKKIAG